MGFTSALTSLFKRWGTKRKLDDNGEPTTTSKKVKLNKEETVSKYCLTPIKDKENKVVPRTQFRFDEKIDLETESKNMEFNKGECLFNKDPFVKLIDRYASAFLNSEGGTLLFGITDQGVVKGVRLKGSRWQSIEDTFKARMLLFRPTIPTGFYKLSKLPVINSGKKGSNLFVVEFVFNKGVAGELYETGANEVFMRRDGGVQGPLRPLDIRTLVISSYKDTLKRRKEGEPVEPVRALVKEAGEQNVDKKLGEMKERLKKKILNILLSLESNTN